MYLPIDPQPTNAQGWLAAASAVQGRGGEAHNVVIDIADPVSETELDAAIIREVDAFLRSHHRNTLSGVANTIFPQSLYDRHGPEAFYGVYRDTVLPFQQSLRAAVPQADLHQAIRFHHLSPIDLGLVGPWAESDSSFDLEPSD